MGFLDIGVGDRAAVGVGVDEQDLAARGGSFEGEVDGDRGAARSALRPPHGGQDPPGVAVGRGRDVRLRGRVLEVGFGQGGAGLVDERLRRVGVGGDVQEPELAEPALAVLVAGRGHPDHREPGGGQPGQGVTVQPPGARGDDGHLGLAGGGHGEQVAQVVAAVQHLGRHLSGLAVLHQRRFPRRTDPRGHHSHLHDATTEVSGGDSPGSP
jgi:hypothetical protein